MLERVCGGDPERLTGPMVTEAAEEGDPLALGGFAVGRRLARASAWPTSSRRSTPTCVVIGGGVSAAGDLLLDPARVR